MATTIFFNGRVTAIPGSYSEVDATGLAVVGLGASGIVACLGEAEGGSPYNGDTPVHQISNPGKVGRTFRSGDLREAGNILFDPSKDPDIPSGAQEVKFVKVNPATRSSTLLANADGDVLLIESRDYGLFTTQISITVEDGTTQGKAITIDDGAGNVEEFDDVGGDPAFTAQYTPGADGATTMLMDLDNTVGVSADFTRDVSGKADEYTGTYGGISGEDDQFSATITPGNVVDVVSDNAADITQSVTIVGIDNGSGLPATETLVLNGVTPVVGAVAWSKVLGVFMDAAAVGTVSVNDNGAATLLTSLAPGVLDRGIFDFGGDVMEVANAIVNFALDAAGTEQLIIVGTDDSPAATAELITLNGTTDVPTSDRFQTISYLAIGEVPAARTLTLTSLMWNQGTAATIVSSSGADTTQRATLYGVDGANLAQTETVLLTGTTPVVTTGTWNRIFAVVLDGAAAGTVTVTDGSALTAFSLAPAELSKGFEAIDNVRVSGTTVDIADSGAPANRGYLVVGLDGGGAAQAESQVANGGTNTTTATWSAITGLAVGHVGPGRTLIVSGEAFDLPLSTYETVNDIAQRISSFAGWDITIGVNAGPLLISELDNSASSDVIVAKEFYADLAFIAQVLNDESQLVQATIQAGATGAPDNVGPVFLVGGTEGVTAFADWQAALDILRDEFANTIVVLTDDEAVHAAVVAHCAYMGGPGRKERDCVLGADSGIDFTAAKARAVALNTRHARLCIQDMVRFNVDGEREQFPPYFTACIAAGMQAGSSVGTSLTFKFLNVLDVVGDDSTYTLQDDANELIQRGLCVVEKVQGVGFRWLRNITTHLIDNNLAFIEASVNEAVNFSTFNIRTNLEAVVGKKGFAGTVNSAAAIVIQTLGLLSDPQDPVVVAWRNLTIELENDVMTIDVELAPVIPVNFVKTTIHLVSASFSAAA